MRSEVSDTATGTSEEPHSETGAVEQIAKTPSFESQLIQLAQADGLMEPSKAEDPPQPTVEEPPVQDEPKEVEPPPEETAPETPAEATDTGEEKEQEPSAKDTNWPESAKARVAEETAKKRRANDRADRAEQETAKLQAQLVEAQRMLAQSAGPVPTEANPLIDVQSPLVLDKLEKVYEALEEVDVENADDDGAVAVPKEVGDDGRLVWTRIGQKEARLAQVRADRMLRKLIPQRRQYLAQRAEVDAGTVKIYPDLQNPENDFTRMVNDFTNKVISGQASNNPEVKFWVANAIYGWIVRNQELQAQNGNGTGAAVQKLVKASQQRIAPTASRTRALVERRSSTDLAKTQKAFEKEPSPENAEAYVGAILSGKSSQRTVRPVAE